MNANHIDQVRAAMSALARKSTESWTEGDMLDTIFSIAEALGIGLSATERDDE